MLVPSSHSAPALVSVTTEQGRGLSLPSGGLQKTVAYILGISRFLGSLALEETSYHGREPDGGTMTCQ